MNKNLINSEITPTPPFLLGAAVIFWGWQTGLWFFAVPMAVILEVPRFLKFRWDFQPLDFNRISDLCTLLFLGMLAWLFISRRTVFVIFQLIEWLPMSFFPLMFCQNYSVSEKIDIRAISMFFRKHQKTGYDLTPLTFNLDYPYAALCILSASFANVRNSGFYLGLVFLSAWAVISAKPKRNSPFLFIILFSAASFAGYAGHTGIKHLQNILEIRGMEWFYDLTQSNSDPYQSITAIGRIGEIKLSNKIIFRVKPETAVEIPLLLREASYNKYNLSRWFARYPEFEPVNSIKDGTDWELFKPSEPLNPQVYKKIVVSEYLNKGQGMLKLPNGAFKVQNLPVFNMEKNQFGAVRVKEGPGFVNYGITFGADTGDSLPGEDDLSMPDREAAAVAEIVQALKLKDKTPKQVLKTINSFFLKNFQYSLKLDHEYTPVPLADFLINTRTGHCEYFASATVLLLRASEIPARYAVGYSAQEYSGLEDQLIVRDSHAHAWALAYINGTWQDIDNTPSSWQTQEAEQVSSWYILTDLWSWIHYKFSQWQWRKPSEKESFYLIWVLIPLVLVLSRRLYFKKRIVTVREPEKKEVLLIRTGKDSYFYGIEKSLNTMGYIRYPGETLYNWIKRIENMKNSEINFLQLYDIVKIHYQYRFDPEGIRPDIKKDFNAQVSKWIEENSKT